MIFRNVCLQWAMICLCLFFLKTGAFARSPDTLELSLGVAQRTDQLRWSISGISPAGNNVDILSELTWEDLSIVQATARWRLMADLPDSPFSFYGRGTLGFGEIFRGDNQDSDYNESNRVAEFSRSNNDANQGDVLDVTFGIGLYFKHRIKNTGNTFGIAPLAGLSYHEQNIKITNGFQTIPPFGPFPNLDSTYETKWRGPWVGFDLSFNLESAITFFGSVAYHWYDYRGKANWNLRSDLAHPVSFFQIASGTGIKSALGVEKRVSEKSVFVVKMNYLDWTADPGIDHVFFRNGIQITTPLREVRWRSYAFTLEFRYALE